MLAKAQTEAPANPKIAAMLAIAQVRLAFFMGDTDPRSFVRARRRSRARRSRPHRTRCSRHLAMGHVELNTGDRVVAAGHFRVAIACAPHSAEAHEQLGRMLLEAGYIDQAIERLEDAIAINPNVRSARWEIARAYALEARWDDSDRLVAELIATRRRSPVSRARYAWWRRDHADADHAARHVPQGPADVHARADVDVHRRSSSTGQWPERRAHLARCRGLDRRRISAGARSSAQLVAEAAGFSGDIATALDQIELSISFGLFDLHWLDKCPLLDEVRLAPRFAELRARIKQRADAILDALYGDHHLGTSETAVASGI